MIVNAPISTNVHVSPGYKSMSLSPFLPFSPLFSLPSPSSLFPPPSPFSLFPPFSQVRDEALRGVEKERDEALFLIDHMEDHADEGFNRIQQQSVKVATEVRKDRGEKKKGRETGERGGEYLEKMRPIGLDFEFQ